MLPLGHKVIHLKHASPVKRYTGLNHQSNNSSTLSNIEVNENGANNLLTPPLQNDKMFVEDFDPIIDQRFKSDIVDSYFRDLFNDVAIRSHSPKSADIQEPYIDNVAFFEFTKLPGIICDRFFSTFKRTKDNFIFEESFVAGFQNVFLSTLEEKMQLTYKM